MANGAGLGVKARAPRCACENENGVCKTYTSRDPLKNVWPRTHHVCFERRWPRVCVRGSPRAQVWLPYAPIVCSRSRLTQRSTEGILGHARRLGGQTTAVARAARVGKQPLGRGRRLRRPHIPSARGGQATGDAHASAAPDRQRLRHTCSLSTQWFRAADLPSGRHAQVQPRRPPASAQPQPPARAARHAFLQVARLPICRPNAHLKKPRHPAEAPRPCARAPRRGALGAGAPPGACALRRGRARRSTGKRRARCPRAAGRGGFLEARPARPARCAPARRGRPPGREPLGAASHGGRRRAAPNRAPAEGPESNF